MVARLSALVASALALAFASVSTWNQCERLGSGNLMDLHYPPGYTCPTDGREYLTDSKFFMDIGYEDVTSVPEMGSASKDSKLFADMFSINLRNR